MTPSEGPGRRLPDFFIVGHHKSGTTALYEMLRRHPEIFMPSLKEPRFFDADLHAFSRTPQNTGRPQTLDEYLDLFAGASANQRWGEASPSYLRSAVAAGAIAQVAPAARSIAILREPASFVRSLHSQMVQEHVETEQDLRRAFEREQIDRDGRRVRRYSDHIHYTEQLRRFHEAFPREQVLVLIYDDFRTDNEGTVRKTLRFLGVDEHAPVEALEVNPSVSVRSVRLDRAVRSLYSSRSPAARAAKAAVRTLTPGRFHRGALPAIRKRLVYAEQAQPDEQLMAELRARYAGEVAAVSEYLGRDLVAEWGYEGLV
ncbi:MAG TPA: sulfotransferase [Solirubrobacteraceae bacterium]|nr:sulfotransferase [Solirubrobacteraceae bacterium]